MAIAREDGDDRRVKPLSRILSSGDRMSRMIDQLLDFTRMRMGSGIPVNPEDADLVPLIRQVMDELEDNHPHWTLTLTESGNTHGRWDADRLQQVFSNLISNAVQHGVATGGVQIMVDGRASQAICIEVRNTGAIPADRLPKLFEPLAGNDKPSPKAAGLGLGLYITREIVRAHDGQIRAQSNGSETIFTVELPRDR